MGRRTGWDRFEKQDDGYFQPQLTLADEHTDSGALVHLARRREQEKVVAFLRRRAEEQDSPARRAALFVVAAEIEEGEHYRASQSPTPDAYYAANLRNA